VLTLDVASRLDHFTRKPLLRNSLRLMRGPARAAGLAELQQFLESGFDTFRAMDGAQEFIRVIEDRERALAASLFQADLKETERGGHARPCVGESAVRLVGGRALTRRITKSNCPSPR
jgi:hypothetical protein